MELVFTKWVLGFFLCSYLVFSKAYSGRPQLIFIYPVSAHYFNMGTHRFILIQVEGILGDNKVRGVNLGGWLVIEGWIKPSLFEGIPNGDMLVSFIFFLVVFCSVSSLDTNHVLR